MNVIMSADCVTAGAGGLITAAAMSFIVEVIFCRRAAVADAGVNDAVPIDLSWAGVLPVRLIPAGERADAVGLAERTGLGEGAAAANGG